MTGPTNPNTVGTDGAEIFRRYADGAAVGDIIPFYDEGVYHLFSLTPPVGALFFPERLRTTWRHLRSPDLARWERLPDALAPGQPGDPDHDGVWTGSVVRVGAIYHIFYTGHVHGGKIPQTVCHATSTDAIHWAKDGANPLSVPDLDRFEGRDWRDPFVFWNESESCYWMLLSARSLALDTVSRGVVALQTSTDLRSWSPAEVLYEAFLTHCPECPEVFRLGGKWVMAYSRFTGRRGTVYRFADQARGPWRSFGLDGPDGANWYAAKSLTDGVGRRIAFGWVPDRDPTPSRAAEKWLWGGDCAVSRELQVDDESNLVIGPADEVSAAFNDVVACVPSYGPGSWRAEVGPSGYCFDVDSIGRLGYCVLTPTEVATEFIVSVTMPAAAPATIIGLAVQTDDQLDRGFAVLCYPRNHTASGVDLTAFRPELDDGGNAYAPVAEISLAQEPLDALSLRVIVRRDIVEAFVGTRACFTYRLPSREAGLIALLVHDGSARFANFQYLGLDSLGRPAAEH